jgi:hypothetical protein
MDLRYFPYNVKGDPEVQALMDRIVALLVKAQVRPKLIWIYIRTGLMPTERNMELLSRDDKREILAVQKEYEAGDVDLEAYIEAARRRLEAK